MTLRVYVGSYVGDNSDDRWITGINNAGTSFTPQAAFLIGIGSAMTGGRLKFGSPTLDMSHPWAASNIDAANFIQQFANGSIQVGASNANSTGSIYHFLALDGDSSDLVVGTYTGNSADNRHIATTISPQLVIVAAGSPGTISVEPSWKSVIDATTDISQRFSGATVNDTIQNISGSGFEIGTNNRINATGSQYRYLVLGSSLSLKFGSYVGNGVDNRDMNIGLAPQFVVLSQTFSGARARFSTMVGDTHMDLANNPTLLANNGIQAFSGSGFELGTSSFANGAAGSTFYYIALGSIGSGALSITANANIQTTYTMLATSKSLIMNGSTCNPFLYEKKNNGSDTLQAVEVRDGHSMALKNVLSFFNSNIGSTLQTDYQHDTFATDIAFKSKHMIYASGGSYQFINSGSTFWMLITCGSLNPSDFNINGCRCYKYSQGSYLLYGPDGPSLGSSRARVMKTLFYGNANQFQLQPRAGSEYIYQLGSMFVSTNSFSDVGRRAYYAVISGNASGGVSEQKNFQMQGSFEASSGSVWSWSYITTSSSANADTFGSWLVPVATNRNSTVDGTSDETGLDTSNDVAVNPANALHLLAVVTAASATGQGSVFSYFLTNGSFSGWTDMFPGQFITYGSRLRDFMTDGLPKFGSVTDAELLDYTYGWVQFNPVTGINGSVDTVIIKTIGSLSSDTFKHLYVCGDGGSNFTYICDGILGSIGPVTGSIVVKYDLYRSSTIQRDYVNAYGVYYG